MIDIRQTFKQQRGLKARVAQALGITDGAVAQWSRVPAQRVLDVERVTGVHRSQLRPDLYPAEDVQ